MAVVAFASVATSLAQPTPKPAAAWTPAAMLKVQRVANVQPSPDGNLVAFTVREAMTDGDLSEYRTHVFLSRADGSDTIQLTRGDKSCDQPLWSPQGEWLAFVSGRNGKTNLYRIRIRGGEAEQLTDVKTGIGSYHWSPDGSRIAFTMADPPTDADEARSRAKNDARVVDEDLKMVHLHVIDVESAKPGPREPRRLTKGGFSVAGDAGGFDWSPDGKAIAFTHTHSPKANHWPTADLSRVEVATGAVAPLAKTEAAETNPRYSPDGRWLAFVASDEPPTWAASSTVKVMPAAGGPARELAATPDRQPILIGWVNNQRLLCSEGTGTTTQLLLLPLDGTPETLSLREGTLSGVGLSREVGVVGFSAETAGRAPEAFQTRIDRWEPVAVSRVNHDLPAGPPGRTEVIRWKSPDGLEIEGLLTYPAAYELGQRYPLLLVIHGGPTGVFQQTFTGTASPYPIAAFAAHDFAVLRCNVRGSSGYGRKFRYANYKDWGGGDFRDLMSGVDRVIQLGVADGDRLGVMGWSYGGFMTSWVITQTKRFRAATVGAGVTNLMSFTGTSDIPSFLPDYFGAEPWDDLETYRTHSAMFQVKGVKTPTLILHGEKDDRVPISQGYELYNALKRQGCPTKMVTYPRTPHGIQEPKLLLDAMNRNVEWFDKYVKGTN